MIHVKPTFRGIHYTVQVKDSKAYISCVTTYIRLRIFPKWFMLSLLLEEFITSLVKVFSFRDCAFSYYWFGIVIRFLAYCYAFLKTPIFYLLFVFLLDFSSLCLKINAQDPNSDLRRHKSLLPRPGLITGATLCLIFLLTQDAYRCYLYF